MISRSSLKTAFCRDVLARGLCVVAAALSLNVVAGTRPAEAQSTWNGTTTDYNTGTNWTPNTAPTSAGQSAVFSNTGSTAVNVSSAISPDSWTFNTNSQSYTVTGQNVTFGAGGIVSNANAGQSITIANNFNLGGAGGRVQQLGNSTLTLSGFTDYTGGTLITAGTLQLTGNGTLGDQHNTTTISGGTLDLGQVIRGANIPVQTALNQSGGTVQNGIFLANIYQLTGGTLAASGEVFADTIIGLPNTTVLLDMQSGTVNGQLAGSAPLQKSTAGTVTLAGVNSYTGGTVISAGTLALTGAGTLGATTNGTAISGGTLDLGTTTQTQASLSQSGGTLQNGTMNVGTYQLTGGTLASTALVSASTTFDMQAGTVNGVLAGAGQLQKSTAGAVTLSAANTYAGGTMVSAGTLALSGAGTLGAATNATAISGGTLDLGTSTQTQASLSQSGGTVQNGTMNVGTYLLTGGTLASTAFVSASTTFDIQGGTVNGVLAGTGQLQKSTASTVALTGANTYTGGTVISAGTLALTGAGSIANSSQVNLANAASTFDISGTTAGATVTTLAGVANSHVTLGAQTLTLSNASTGYAGIIQGTGGLTVTGGTQTLNSTNTYTGATTINGGTLVVNGSTVASSLTTVNAGGTLAGAGLVGGLTVNSGGVFAPGPTGSAGGMMVFGNLTFQPGATYRVQVTPATASLANVSGNTSLAGTVNAQFSPGSYLTNNYTILATPNGNVNGRFSNLVTTNLPAGFTTGLSYDANGVVLNLTAHLAPAGGLGANRGNVGSAISNAFNNGSALPPNFVTLFGISGANLSTALT
jgi:autotransporter-associated beta strand protein